MGTYHDGFCDSLAMNIAEAGCSVGDSGPAHQVGTFSCCTDDLHTGGILQVIHTRDRSVKWSVSLYRIRLGSQVYNSLLEEFPESHENTVDYEHCFSSTDKRPVGEDHAGFGGLLWACVLDLKGAWEEHFPLVEFTYNNSYQASILMTPYRLYMGGHVDL